MSRTYQVILDVPAIPKASFPEAFIALLEAIGFNVSTFSQMPGTQVVTGRRLVQGEVVPMGGWGGEATEIVMAGATANYTGTVSLVGGQTTKKELVVDESGDPILLDGEFQYAIKSYLKPSAAVIAPYIISELSVVEVEAGLLDGSIKLNRHVGAEDWEVGV